MFLMVVFVNHKYFYHGFYCSFFSLIQLLIGVDTVAMLDANQLTHIVVI